MPTYRVELSSGDLIVSEAYGMDVVSVREDDE